MQRIAAVIFDLDGTLVRYCGDEFESSWGAIAVAAGVVEHSRELLREYLPRRADYAEWVARDAKLLAGIPVVKVTQRILPPPYATGVIAAVGALRGRCRMGILSSGVDLVADWVRDDLRLDFSLANHLAVEADRFTGGCETRVDLWAKDVALRALSKEQGISLDEICYVGDHVNDIPVMKLVGLPVAANPKDPRLLEVCVHAIEDFAVLPDLIDAFVAAPPESERRDGRR
jgi:HAD superfamily phosphoserine phosphatase-like hydrolase